MKTMTVSIVQSHKYELETLCRKYNVKELYLFGSASVKDPLPEGSDMDFAAVFSRSGIEGSFDQYMEFKFSLETLFQRPVDLVTINSIRNPVFRLELNATKELVYAA